MKKSSMVLRLLFLWLLTLSVSFGLKPALPRELTEWMRAVDLGHKEALKSSPEILLALSESPSDLKRLQARADLPFEDKKCLDHQSGLRKSIDYGLRMLEFHGHLSETRVVDEIFFGRAGRIRSLDAAVNAARRLALNQSRDSFLRLCETILLTPWMDRHAKANPTSEAGNTYRLFTRERLVLFDLLNDQNLLPDFMVRARAQIIRYPSDFKTVQALIYAGFLRGKLPDDVWKLYSAAAPPYAGWRVEPLFEIAYFCMDRELPAPSLYQQLPVYAAAASEASRLQKLAFVELNLLQATNAIFLSELDEARKFHLMALQEFDKLNESNQLRFLHTKWDLLVASFKEPFVAPIFDKWIERLKNQSGKFEKSMPTLLNLWGAADAHGLGVRMIESIRKLATAEADALLRSKDPNHRYLLRRVTHRYVALMLREGRIEEADRFYEAIREQNEDEKTFLKNYKDPGAWIAAAKTPNQIILMPDPLRKHRMIDRWLIPTVGRSQSGLGAAFFPTIGENYPLIQFFNGQELKPLAEKTPVFWQEGFGKVAAPEEIDSPWVGASFGEGESPLAHVITIQENLLTKAWQTGKDSMPAVVDWRIKEEKNGVVLHPALSKTVELTVDLISSLVPLEEGFNYALSGNVRSDGAHANTKVLIEFFDEEHNPLNGCRVAFQQGPRSNLDNYFQILINQDRSPGPSFQITPKHKFARVILNTSDGFYTHWSNLRFGKYCLSNPEEVIRPKAYLDAKAKPFLEFNHPVDAMATNDKHESLAVAIGATGELFLYPGGKSEPHAVRKFPENTEVNWLSFAENETVGLLSKRKAAKKGVFYLYREDGTEVVIPIKGQLLTQTLDRMGRWMCWIELSNGTRSLCYHDLRKDSATTIRGSLDLPKDEKVMAISSIWTSDGVGLLGDDWRRFYSFPGMKLERTLVDQMLLNGPESPGLSRIQSNNFLMSSCVARPLPSLVCRPLTATPLWVPIHEQSKMIQLKRGGPREGQKVFEFSDSLERVLPIRVGLHRNLEKNLLFTMKKTPTIIRKLEVKDVRKAGLDF